MALMMLPVTAEHLSPFDTLPMPVLFITGNHEEYYGKKKFLETITKTNISYIGNDVMKYNDMNFIGVD